LLSRLISGGELNSPWGIVMTPSTFAAAPNSLLIGNFGDGLINVYTFDMSTPEDSTATLISALRDTAGAPLAIEGLWSLEFGPDAGGFSSNVLYFTAGPQDEMQGVFGRLQSSTLGASNTTQTPVSNTQNTMGSTTQNTQNLLSTPLGRSTSTAIRQAGQVVIVH
jgi:hypothetical protein